MEPFALHHIGVATVRDLIQSNPRLQEPFALRIGNLAHLTIQFRTYRCAFSVAEKETLVIELVAPLGPNSPIDRTLKKGGGPYHLCYEVPDINAAIRHFTEQGSLLHSGPVPAVAFEMREIAWLMTEVDLLVELVQA